MDAMQAYIQLDGRNNRKTASPARATPPRDHGTESELYNSSGSRARYEAYSKLQASAVAFGESVPIPEIVAVGGQSDGKSSLLEALLGFRFNIREVEMGTRRPLMLQMIHDASATEPRCRLQEEDSDDYGPAISSASAVAEAIRSRTESFLKKIGTTVASKPIVMRAEYAFCPNLTIIDTPGFVLKAKKGELESTPDDILAMVRELAAPQHRILLFLQQSSVEWCSSLWLDSIRAIDPTLSRTIVVVSKFDNRLKEFAERWEVDRYLSAGGYLGDNARPFFVALPKERSSMSNDEFRRQIMKVDNEIVRHLRDTIAGGFDEEQFENHIGFSNLRKHLELELQRRYRQSAPATLALLERRCEEVALELSSIDAQLKSTQDVACLRRAGMLHAGAVARHVVALLDGVSEPHPAEWGRTTDEERMESRLSKWPGVSSEIRPANAGLRMYGGASFERVLEEFRCAACSLDCPPISRVEVANILLAQAGRAGPAAAAVTIARAAAKSWLGPLLDTACDRLAHILTNLFDLALERIRIHESSNESSVYGETLMKTNLTGYIAFHAALRRAHQRFIRNLNKHCKDSVRDHLIAVTSAYSNQLKFGWESHPTMFSNGFGSGLSQNLSVPFCVEAQDFRESVPHFDAGNDTVDEENFPPKGSQMDRVNGESLSPGKERFPLKESQQTVPDTPSPEPSQGPSKRKDYVVSNGGLNPSKKKGAAGLRLQHMNGGSKSDVYAEVCSLAADHFGKIREMLVKRTVPFTLNSGFLNPCRDLLSGEIGVDLFAVTDDRFMEMFIAPGAVEQLEVHREALSKRCSTLNNCLDEFRALARSI